MTAVTPAATRITAARTSATVLPVGRPVPPASGDTSGPRESDDVGSGAAAATDSGVQPPTGVGFRGPVPGPVPWTVVGADGRGGGTGGRSWRRRADSSASANARQLG